MPSVGYYDEPYRAKPEGGTPDDDRRSMDRTNRRIDILFNLMNRFLDADVVTTDITLTGDQYNVMVDTDSAARIITLPAGKARFGYRIVNVGTSGNAVTITPDGTDLLLGANSSYLISDGEAMVILYEAGTPQGWQ